MTQNYSQAFNNGGNEMLKIKGLKEFSKKLDSLAKNAKELDGTHSVPVSELLTSSFISKHTRFSNANEMFEASGFKIESPEDFKAIPDDKWDDFIRSISSFQNWQSMLTEATKAWATKKLGF
jgi:hypothetical protein